MATKADLSVDQGTFHEFIITVDDEVAGLPVLDLSNYSVSGNFGEYYTARTKYNLTVEIYNASNGQIKLKFLPEDTVDLRIGNYVYNVDIQSTIDTTDIKRVLEGVIFLNPKV